MMERMVTPMDNRMLAKRKVNQRRWISENEEVTGLASSVG